MKALQQIFEEARALGSFARGIPATQYHGTSWERVPLIMAHGLNLPIQHEGRTFVHEVPTISTADRIEDAALYGPAILQLRVRPHC